MCVRGRLSSIKNGLNGPIGGGNGATDRFFLYLFFMLHENIFISDEENLF